MAQEVCINEHFWRCDGYPWGCDKKHTTLEEAEACERYQGRSSTRGKLESFRNYKKKG